MAQMDMTLDDEMNSLDDDDGGSVCSGAGGGRLSVCSQMSSLSLNDQSGAEDEPRAVYSRTGSALQPREDGFKPALWPSLFDNVPPVIYFSTAEEKVSQLPYDVRKLLKWKPSSICPIVVKNIILRAGFRWSKRSNDWVCYWGKHMKSECFKGVKEYQRVNHFPGTFQIGRKDRLYRNLSKLQSRYGQRHFNFFPNSFVLPQDGKQLKRTWDEGGFKHKWILKPPASARGIGIRVINKWNQIPKKRPVIVQRYISRPFLINQSKFDLRIYVFVTCYDPLRIYVNEDGLVRFASQKYSNSVKSISNKFMHLTNYSINKNNSEYQSNSDQTKCDGHKWTLQALWQWMSRRGIDHRKIWDGILDIVVKTIIASEPAASSSTKANVKCRKSCFELFGFDIILDDSLKPWILEVNISPSLHSNSELDISVKEPMLRDIFNMIGVTVPDKDEVAAPGTKFGCKIEFMKEGKILRDAQLVPNERSKHAYYMQRCADENTKSTILDVLTGDDVRQLVETEDELNRCGGFIRVFPTPTSSKYLRFFDQPKYNNLLLDEWVKRYAFMPSRGIAILDQLCEARVHLGEKEESCRWSALGLPSSVSAYRYHPPHIASPRKLKSLNQTAKPSLSRSAPNEDQLEHEEHSNLPNGAIR